MQSGLYSSKVEPHDWCRDDQEPFCRKTNESNFFLMVIFNCNKAVAYNVPHHFEDN